MPSFRCDSFIPFHSASLLGAPHILYFAAESASGATNPKKISVIAAKTPDLAANQKFLSCFAAELTVLAAKSVGLFKEKEYSDKQKQEKVMDLLDPSFL